MLRWSGAWALECISRMETIRLFSLALTVVLAAQLSAQEPSAGTSAERGSPDRVTILVLEGDDAVNSLAEGTTTTPVVEIRDSNDLPIENAIVTFKLPASGPGAEFNDGSREYTVRTNVQGQARAPMKANSVPGEFEISVTATIDNRSAETRILQTNLLGSTLDAETYIKKRDKRWYQKKTFWIVTGAAAAGAVAAILATSGSDGKITINPGSPTFGGPQ